MINVCCAMAAAKWTLRVRRFVNDELGRGGWERVSGRRLFELVSPVDQVAELRPARVRS